MGLSKPQDLRRQPQTHSGFGQLAIILERPVKSGVATDFACQSRLGTKPLGCSSDGKRRNCVADNVLMSALEHEPWEYNYRGAAARDQRYWNPVRHLYFFKASFAVISESRRSSSQ